MCPKVINNHTTCISQIETQCLFQDRTFFKSLVADTSEESLQPTSNSLPEIPDLVKQTILKDIADIPDDIIKKIEENINKLDIAAFQFYMNNLMINHGNALDSFGKSTKQAKSPHWKVAKKNKATASKVWQYGLWSFQTGGRKLERVLPNNQYTQRKLLNFENWVIWEVSKIGHHFRE